MNRHFFAPTIAAHTSQLLLIAAADADADVVVLLLEKWAHYFAILGIWLSGVLILLCTLYPHVCTLAYTHTLCVCNKRLATIAIDDDQVDL